MKTLKALKDLMLIKIIKWTINSLSDEAHESLIMHIIFAHATVIDTSDEGMQELLDSIEDDENPKVLN